jgi:hypothetical protein
MILIKITEDEVQIIYEHIYPKDTRDAAGNSHKKILFDL